MICCILVCLEPLPERLPYLDMLPAFEARDHKTVNNPMEAYIIAEVRSSFD